MNRQTSVSKLKPPKSAGITLGWGTEILTRQQLSLIPIPEAKERYAPVGHAALADKVLAIANKIVGHDTLINEGYFTGRKGQHLFGFVGLKTDHPEIGISIAFRNSYNRSLSIAISVGGFIISGNNLALPTGITVMKKHTREALKKLEDDIILTLHKQRQIYEKVIMDANRLKNIRLTEWQAYHLMGELFGTDIISPRQLSVLKTKCKGPSRRGRDMWSFLNMTLESLKTAPPDTIMEKLIQGYQFLTSGQLPL